MNFPDRLLIGEFYLPESGCLLSASWCAPAIARLIGEYEAALPAGGWPNWVLGNNDRPRIASRVGPHQARIAAMLLLTLRGTPTI
jgi:alpha-glucosidase